VGPPRIAVVSTIASVISVIAVVASVIAQVMNPIYLWQPPLLLVDGDAHLEKMDEREPALLSSSLVCPLHKVIYGLNKP
jgi:hypothetical protein